MVLRNREAIYGIIYRIFPGATSLIFLIHFSGRLYIPINLRTFSKILRREITFYRNYLFERKRLCYMYC